ncbi:MAG: LysM peptidoglycan-binding domain-containing protein, partial [Helicobacter sp.]|nr:LysM peptidoglycan-binding domain-containing protein [Helicobacter sp.]
ASLITSIEVPPATSLQKVAAQAGLSLRELKQYNPHFIKNTTPAKARLYTVYLPYKFLATYQEKNQDLQNISFLVHRVNRGDTLSSIAKQYGVSSKKIIRYNTIKNAHSISINQEIIIPLEKDSV